MIQVTPQTQLVKVRRALFTRRPMPKAGGPVNGLTWFREAELAKTGWFESQTPQRQGPYQVLVAKSELSVDDPIVGYQYWNGLSWGTFATTANLAEDFKDKVSVFQSPIWRGLADKPV